MNEINIAEHLLLPLIFSAGIIVIAFLFRSYFFSKNYFKSFWISGVVFFVLYSFILGLACYEDFVVQIELYKFDTDQNGVFNAKERNAKGYDEAMKNLINDTGRNFAPFFSVMFSAMISIPILIIGLLIEKFKKNSAKEI